MRPKLPWQITVWVGVGKAETNTRVVVRQIASWCLGGATDGAQNREFHKEILGKIITSNGFQREGRAPVQTYIQNMQVKMKRNNEGMGVIITNDFIDQRGGNIK